MPDETPRITDDQLCERAKAARSSLYDEMDGWPFDNTGDAIMAGYERGFRDAEDRLRAALAEAEAAKARVEKLASSLMNVPGNAGTARHDRGIASRIFTALDGTEGAGGGQ